MTSQITLMDAASIEETLDRMADQICESCDSLERLALVGIRTAGVHLARRLQFRIEARIGRAIRFGCLDITLYRDDLYSGLEKPLIGPTDITFDIDRLEIVLVDDVLFTGRTIRAALDELMDLGRPRRILLAVLMDRGHRELPIRADIVGKYIPTSKAQQVKVHLGEDARYQADQVILLDYEAKEHANDRGDERNS